MQFRCIKTVDTRDSSGIAQTIEGAHDGCVNCVRWHPSNQRMLASTGTDPYLRLWDLRQTQQPVHSFQGHTLKSRWVLLNLRFQTVVQSGCTWLA